MDLLISKALVAPMVMSLLIGVFTISLLAYFWNARQRNTYSPFTEGALRLPGQSLQIKHSRLLDKLVAHYLIFLLVPVIALLQLNKISGIPFVLSVFALSAFSFFMLHRTWKMMDELNNYKLGLEGEQYTGQELNLLMRNGAYVFHDLPYKYGNIDHVVIGGDKIFAIETKTRRKSETSAGAKDAVVVVNANSLRIAGYESGDALEQARLHAEHLQNAIKNNCGIDFPVHPVVALPGRYINKEGNAGDVQVMNPRRGKYLKKQLGKVSN